MHTGLGSQLHSYPFLPNADLACKPLSIRVGTVTVKTELDDPGGLAPDDVAFEGRFECELDGDDVTPADDTWRSRPDARAAVLSDQLPVGAVCTLTQDAARGALQVGRARDNPARVVVAKREVRGFTVTNRLVPPPPAPSETPTATPTPTPAASPAPPPSLTPTGADADRRARHRSRSPPTLRAPTPSSAPTSEPTESTSPPARGTGPGPPKTDAGPVTTTAPFTLRGTFVWGPLLILSLLTLLLRVPRRPARRH